MKEDSHWKWASIHLFREKKNSKTIFFGKQDRPRLQGTFDVLQTKLDSWPMFWLTRQVCNLFQEAME